MESQYVTILCSTSEKVVIPITLQDSTISLVKKYREIIESKSKNSQAQPIEADHPVECDTATSISETTPKTIRLIYAGTEISVNDNRTLGEIGIGRHGNWTIHAVVKDGESSTKVAIKPRTSRTKRSIVPTAIEVDSSEIVSSRRSSRKRNSVIDLSVSEQEVIDLESEDVEPQPERKRRRPAAGRTATSSSSSTSNAEPIVINEEESADENEASHRSPKPVKEKRASKLRHGTAADDARIHRALSQRLYLLNQADDSVGDGVLSRRYDVLGSTGNIYEIVIGRNNSCTCPDFVNGYLCKHIIFVMVKVLRVPASSYLVHQRSLLQSELKDIFSKANILASKEVVPNEGILKAYELATGNSVTEVIEVSESSSSSASQPDDGDLSECPICFEDINGKKKESCEDCSVCKIRIHSDCIKRWITRGSSSCPQCRTDWKSSHQTSGSYQPNYVRGYINLGR